MHKLHHIFYTQHIHPMSSMEIIFSGGSSSILICFTVSLPPDYMGNNIQFPFFFMLINMQPDKILFFFNYISMNGTSRKRAIHPYVENHASYTLKTIPRTLWAKLVTSTPRTTPRVKNVTY